MVTLNFFVVPNKILGKISTAAASSLLDIDGNSSSIFSKIGQDQLLTVLSVVAISSRSLPILEAKHALGIFGVVTSVKLKSAGLWQYTVVYFKNTFSATATLIHWFVLVRKDTAVSVVLPAAAAADMDLNLGGSSKTITPVVTDDYLGSQSK
ncbi:hypothetical protein G9A89_003731 [Geosiphon pyriformis]|nr:hypothetical protein G9A89_003731 [Geosiphon pyriformis]